MNNLVAHQVREVLSGPARCVGLACEAPLRVAAATLASADTDDIGATTVVGAVGTDDLAAFQKLVADSAAEYDLDARVRVYVGSFSVRFSRRSEASASVLDSHAGGHTSILARIGLRA
jgi:hypothetical protein